MYRPQIRHETIAKYYAIRYSLGDGWRHIICIELSMASLEFATSQNERSEQTNPTDVTQALKMFARMTNRGRHVCYGMLAAYAYQHTCTSLNATSRPSPRHLCLSTAGYIRLLGLSSKCKRHQLRGKSPDDSVALLTVG
ncbi:unnamed protein product [Fusarium graminearum]|nr:unnamed protein product [Fusarium graminearum]